MRKVIHVENVPRKIIFHVEHDKSKENIIDKKRGIS